VCCFFSPPPTAMSVIPMHGKQKELGTGLVNRIKKDLGLN
jgi:predicted RNA binding protein YcfA (HicA-like mRNA interferase family)